MKTTIATRTETVACVSSASARTVSPNSTRTGMRASLTMRACNHSNYSNNNGRHSNSSSNHSNHSNCSSNSGSDGNSSSNHSNHSIPVAIIAFIAITAATMAINRDKPTMSPICTHTGMRPSFIAAGPPGWNAAARPHMCSSNCARGGGSGPMREETVDEHMLVGMTAPCPPLPKRTSGRCCVLPKRTSGRCCGLTRAQSWGREGLKPGQRPALLSPRAQGQPRVPHSSARRCSQR